MKYHLTPVKMAIIKKKKTTSVGEDVEKLKPLHTVGGKMVQSLWKSVSRFLKKLKVELPYDPAIPLLGI